MANFYEGINKLDLTKEEKNKLFVHFTKNSTQKSEAELVLKNFCKTDDDKLKYFKSFSDTLLLPDGMLSYFFYFILLFELLTYY
jgi:hypothetical protein